MSKRIFCFTLLAMLFALLAVSAFAATDTVYLDGTGETDGAYTDLKSAVSALPNGGTVIVSGNTTVGTANTGVALAKVGGKVTITSEKDAVLTLARSLTLASEMEFNNITICNTHSSNGRIIANGNKITIGQGVTTTTTVDRYPSIIGGKSSTTCTSSHVIIQSGTWFCVFGGNFQGAFNGNSIVDFTGGTIQAVLTGGNRTSNFTGNATLNIGGDAVIEYNKYDETDGYTGVIGGTMGLPSGTACTFNGDIAINISGNASVAATIFGSHRYSNVTMTGDITVTVGGNAELARNLYAGGYYGNVTTGENGIRVIVKDNAKISPNCYVCAGASHSKTITGDGHVAFYDNAYLKGAVYAGGHGGSFTGNTSVTMYGGTVTSTVSAKSYSGSVSGTQTVTLYGGTAGPVKGDVTIDLAADESVTMASCTGTVTTVVPDGYEVVVNGTTYTAREIPTEPAPTLVYVDGTGNTEGAYTDLASAALALREGGTIVVAGTVKIDSAITLAAGGDLLITSVYGDEDYTDSAAIAVAADIALGAATTFKDVTLDKVASGNIYLVANGNKLVIDEGVYCRNTIASNHLTIVGGARNGTFEGNADITVKSGYFRNIYGGNYNGTFKGTSHVTWTGGYVDNMVTGGSFQGNFEGDATLDIGGDSVFVYREDASGINGSCCGSGTGTYTFDGDIYINLYGSARINQNVYGTTRWSNVTTTGDVTITIKDDAFVYQNLYAGGYGGTLNGNTKVIMDDGWVGVNLTAGNRSGTVNGDTYLEINGGKVNYYATNFHASQSHVAGTYDVAGGGLTGAVNGNTTVVINGGDIYGNVYGGSIDTGTVSGSSTVTLTGGSIWCGAYADGATAGTVSGTKTLNIDLSAGGSLALGMAADVNALTGGGALTLFPEAVITADSFSGSVALSINGKPQARNYITAAATENASVTYTAQSSEQFVSADGVYGISSEGYHATTRVIFKHYPGVQIYPRAGLVTTGDRMTATSVESEQTIFDFAPGLYNFAVYHTQDDFKRKYIYITGEEETLTLDLTKYTPMVGGGFESSHFYENSAEIHETFYNTDDLVGFARPDSPFFNNNRDGQRLFTSNTELVEFVNTKVAACDYAYAFDLFTSLGGNTMPLVLFTKDEIPANATLEEAAKIVSATEGRDIMMVTAFVHGCEPSAGEGALAMISELCGEYGDNLLTGNVGAVIIIPRLNPDGSETFTTEALTAVGEKNLNRDYAMLTSEEISGVVHAFDIFEPTLLIDCHEAELQPKFSGSGTLTDIYDVGIMCAGTLNNPFVDATAAIKGDYANRGMRMAELITEAMEGIEETGLRAYYYQSPSLIPAINSAYGLTNGTYAFIVEVSGISGGDSFFERRVFAQVTTLKNIFALAAESNGQLAREVNAAREVTALSAQKFDVDTPIVLQHTYTRHDTATMLWNNPLVAADATVRRAENTTKYYLQDVAIKYRSRPTAYVVSADATGIDAVLRVLDIHGIDYALLDAGTTLTLKQYSGSSTAATLGVAEDVIFDAGAYIIPVDGYKAYLIATLFEPENPDSGERTTTFAEAGHLAASDIYRSEENYIAAKLGIDGTYYALDTADKTVASVVADGSEATVISDDGYSLIQTPKTSAIVTYTDGTSETVWFGNRPGDIDDDGTITVIDALLLMRAILNEQAIEGADLNGDGRLGLVDVLRILKYSVV